MIFDVLGRQVATLIDGVKQAGRYSVQWDASGVASGVYYCRLTARPANPSDGTEFVQTRKLVLLR